MLTEKDSIPTTAPMLTFTTVVWPTEAIIALVGRVTETAAALEAVARGTSMRGRASGRRSPLRVRSTMAAMTFFMS